MKQTEIDLRHKFAKWLQYEALLTEISAKYINLQVDQIDRYIEDDQRTICEFLDIDASTLWQWSDEKRKCLLLTHLYSIPGGISRPAEASAEESFPWVYSKMLQGETLIISTEDMLPEAVRDQESRRHYGVKSSVVLPLSCSGRLLGALAFDALREKRVWSDEVIQLLKLTAQIFANALARKESYEKLYETEVRLNLAADSAGAGLWELNLETNLFWATEIARSIFGYDSEEVISMERFEQSVFPDDLVHVRQAISRSLQYKERINIEYRIQLNDGSMKWIHSSGQPYFKPNGVPDRLLGSSVDITERKLAEMRLRESETRCSQLFEGSSDAIFLVDIKTGQYLDANRAAEKLTGHSLDKLKTLTTSDVCPQGAKERLAKLKNSTRTIGREEVEYLRKDGSARTTELTAILINENISFDIAYDITDRKIFEKTILENEARLTSAMEIAHLGFYEMNEDEKITFLDERIRSIFGLSPGKDENGREFWLAHIHEEDLPYILDSSRQVLEDGVDHFVAEYRYIHPARGLTWLHHLSRVTKRTAAGKAAKIIGVVQDITKRKNMEEKLQKNEEILRKNQKDLRRLAGRLISVREEELRRLSGELHDDLTQRLAVIAIEAGKLELNMQEREQILPEFIEEISGIKEQLIKISEDVHGISRQLHPTILDDLGLVRAIESECAILCQREGVEIVFTKEGVPDRLPDNIPLCIYRIVQASLNNIICHSGAKKCEVILKGSGEAIFLVVDDKGVGFDPAEVRDRPGLGLASMRERAQLVGGDFEIDTGPDRGTSIRVNIPLKKK